MLSIVLPLCERLGLGWRALESALALNGPRSGYEVIVVLGEPSASEARRDPVAQDLLARCDLIVQFPDDPAAWDNRIRVYHAAAKLARGDILYLMEGHTVLRPDLAEVIREHFACHPAAVAVTAPAELVSCTQLGRLVDRHHLARRARAPTWFGVGGQSAIRRTTFLELAGTFESYGLLGEVFIDRRMQAAPNKPIILTRSFATHCNDFPPSHWRDFFAHVGRTHERHFDDPLSRNVVAARKQWLLAATRRPALAGLLAPLAMRGGAELLRLAVWLDRAAPVVALAALGLAIKLLIGAGFWRASGERRLRPAKLLAQADTGSGAALV